jgi:hypothetical protein
MVLRLQEKITASGKQNESLIVLCVLRRNVAGNPIGNVGLSRLLRSSPDRVPRYDTMTHRLWQVQINVQIIVSQRENISQGHRYPFIVIPGLHLAGKIEALSMMAEERFCHLLPSFFMLGWASAIRPASSFKFLFESYINAHRFLSSEYRGPNQTEDDLKHFFFCFELR